jgi:hypothetical protein
MSTIINATTTNGVVIQPDNSGSLALQSNGTTIMTVGSTGVSTQVGAPAFSAYESSGTSLSANTWTKIALATEEFDTNSNFSSGRFTPTIAGYYQINGSFTATTTNFALFCSIYKNGSAYKYGNLIFANSGVGAIAVVSSLVYLNGSTDYVEFYALTTSSATSSTGAAYVYFNGSMTRSA